MVFGLEGFEIGDNEADEYPVKPASDGEQGDDVHYSVKDAFEFVHGFGFSGWKKKKRLSFQPVNPVRILWDFYQVQLPIMPPL